ncbi:MAG: hypothetical protein H6605_09565 [Flavobacteriales bacterium]|nr:hypothetical protein [Flavobacteriales bacterium]
MKKLFFVLLISAAVLSFNNCTTESTPVVTTDTTKKVVEPVNTFKFNGITTYDMKWDSLNMFGYYKKNEDITVIHAEGYTNSKFSRFILTIPGKAIGTFKHSVDSRVNIEVTTGQNVTEKEYAFSTQPGKDMTVTITKIDPVNGRIKGGFAGDLQAAGSLETATISSGSYEVVRLQDE